MVGLAVVVLAGFVLLLWLVGHWFGRVLAFLGLMLPLGFVGYLIGAALQNNPVPHPEQFQLLGVIGMILGAAAAWPVSGVPIYIQRRRIVILPPSRNVTRSF